MKLSFSLILTLMLTLVACGGDQQVGAGQTIAPQSLDVMDGLVEAPKGQIDECFEITTINLSMGSAGLATEVIAKSMSTNQVEPLIRFVESTQQTLNNAIDLQVLEMIKFAYQTQSQLCTNVKSVCLPKTIGVANCPAVRFNIKK